MSDDTPEQITKVPVYCQVGDGERFEIGNIEIDLEEASRNVKNPERPDFFDTLRILAQEAEKQVPDIMRKFADLLNQGSAFS